jgi:hypothetical protein
MKFLKKKWFKITCIIFSIPVLLLSIAIGYFYWKQDEIVQKILQSVNETIDGEITIKGSHIALFHKFPYVSIDLEDAILFADKSKKEEQEVIHLEDLYVGFNIIDIIKGDYTIKVIELNKGHVDLIQYEDGSLNIIKILALDSSDTEEESEMLQLALNKIDLDHVVINLFHPHLNDQFQFDFEHIHSRFKSKGDEMAIRLDTKFFGTIFKNEKPTLMNKKVFELDTEIKYLTKDKKIVIDPTKFSLEHIFLDLEGFVELEGEKNIDLKLNGTQDNFNLLISFAPQELIPTLKSYENKGKIYVGGQVIGSMKDGQMPAINAEFGCENGFFKNQKNNVKLDEIEFHGTFTNGEKRDLSTMKFTMNKIKAQPAAGIFDAKLEVVNFKEPDIDLNLKSNFNLDFLVRFLNLEKEIKRPQGYVGITMNFHDIIDLAHPERSIEKLNESYFTEFIVKNLSFESKSFPLPIRNLNVHADINGNKLTMDQFEGQVGNSEISIVGSINDVPAIIHQRGTPVETKLTIRSNSIDITELTYDHKTKQSAVNEKIEQLDMDVAFKCDADALFASGKLPIGEFFLNSFNAKLQNYPHFIHDVSAGLFIEKDNIKIKRLKGEIDESDFLFFGKLLNYQHLFHPTPKAKSEFDVFFKSNNIQLDNLLTYKGEDLLPESIKKETFSDVKLKAKIGARFEGDQMVGTRLELKEFDVTTSLHEKRFTDLSGKIFLRKNSIALKNLKGNIGTSDFDITLNYFTGSNDSLRKRDNEIIFTSSNFNLNEILAIKYNPVEQTNEVEETPGEPQPFSVENIPFMDMKLETNILHFEYLDYKLDRIKGNINMRKQKTIEFERFGFDVAGGKVRLSGKLDASDADNIVFTPRLWIKNLVLDQTLTRFKNFGQDYILSDNLSGKLNAKIRGIIPMNPDLTPKMNATELSFELKIVDGELKNYKPLNEFASFFGDKNLNRIRFDTLDNTFTLKNNLFSIPWMTINSSLGFIEVSGEQSLDAKMEMEYYVKVPLKLVTNVAYQKLFKRRKEEVNPDQEDEIQYGSDKKTQYVNIKMIGNSEDFSIALGKDKRGKKK